MLPLRPCVFPIWHDLPRWPFTCHHELREIQTMWRLGTLWMMREGLPGCILHSANSMKSIFRPRWRHCLAGVGLLAVAFLIWVQWRASSALRHARDEIQASQTLGFTVRRLSPVGSAFEWIEAPPAFSTATMFQGRFFLCGAAGLFEYDAQGGLVKQYRPGQDLPASPLERMAVGTLRGSRQPELFITTAAAGILAYDGERFRQVLPNDPEARTLTSILPAGSGQLLLGTRRRGVLVYDGHDLRPFHPSLSALHVTELAGADADLWVGTLDQGVIHWQAGHAETFTESEGMPDLQVFSIALAGSQTFVGTPMGVAAFEDGKFARVLLPGFFAAALYAGGGRLLASGPETGMVEAELDPAGAKRLNAPNAPLRRTTPIDIAGVRQIFAQGETLLAVTSTDLYQRESPRGGWHRIPLDHGAPRFHNAVLQDRNVSALSLDSSGRLWVGYFDHGLDLLEPDQRSTLHLEDENVFCVNRIVPSPQDNAVAVATANGLVLFDSFGKKRQVLGRADGLLADHVTDAAVYGNGMVLATPAGLTFLDSSGPHSLYAFHGLVNNHVYTISAEGKEVFAGTLGGISVLENENVAANYTIATRGLTHNWISGIVRAGNEWIIGTYGGGIV